MKTVDGAKLEAYLLDAIKSSEWSGIRAARIAIGELFDITVDLPPLPHYDGMLALFGLTVEDAVFSIDMKPDYAEVIRRPLVEGKIESITDRYDYA